MLNFTTQIGFGGTADQTQFAFALLAATYAVIFLVLLRYLPLLRNCDQVGGMGL